MWSRAEVLECLTDGPGPQQSIFHQSYGLVQKLWLFSLKNQAIIFLGINTKLTFSSQHLSQQE